MRRKGDDLSDSEGEESPRARSDDSPAWGNPSSRVRKQAVSFVSQAASVLRGTWQHVPEPRGFRIASQPDACKRADSKQARLVQDAHASANALTVLCNSTPLYRLEKAEAVELQAAALLSENRHGALPPRAVAITVAIDEARLTNRNKLLDAAAFWARVSTSPDTRCVRKTRMAVLAGEDAQKYCAKRAERAKTTRHSRAHAAQVCVTWIVETAASDDQPFATRSEFAEIAYADTPLGYFDALRAAVAGLLTAQALEGESEGESGFAAKALLGVMECTNQLFQTMDAEPGAVEGAYQAGAIETDEEFWKLLVHRTPERLSAPLGAEHNRFLCFDEQKTFLKLVPKGMPQDHPEVFHGLLLYKKGMHDETHEHCVDSATTELTNPCLAPIDPWGLRPPQDSAVDACCLHVLSIHAELVYMGGLVSGFGLLAAPGERLTRYPNCSLPRIVYRLVPFDEQFASTTFALPMDKQLINPADETTWLPLWAFTEDAIVAYLHLFEPIPENADEELPAHRKTSPFQLTKHIAPPTEEDELLRTLLGMPFGVSAFRLGDLYAEAERLRGCPNLLAFLLAAIAELGADAPIARAIGDLTRLCATHKQETVAFKKRIATLVADVDLSRVNADAAVKRAKVELEAASQAKAVETKAEECAMVAQRMACSLEKVNVILRGVGVQPMDQYTLKQPFKRGRIVAIVRAYARASGRNVDDAYADWPYNHAMGDQFTAVDTVLRTLAHASTAHGGGRVVLLVQFNNTVTFHLTDTSSILKVIDQAYEVQNIDPIQALEHVDAAWLHWSEDASALTPLVRV
tara:strand:+ start:2800 stop:5211 length:2412 start_codon:yes stop_codon:yes gene_type:complete